MRIVQDHQGKYPCLWSAVESIAPKVGCVLQTLLEWLKRQEVDIGVRDGVTSTEAERVNRLLKNLDIFPTIATPGRSRGDDARQ